MIDQISTAFAVVVAGGETAPAYLVPVGQVMILPPVASCLATSVAETILVFAGTPDGCLLYTSDAADE